MLGSDLCDYSDGYIVVKETLTDKGSNTNNQTDKNLAFKNNAPFRSSISKFHVTFIDYVKDRDIVMLMYNL